MPKKATENQKRMQIVYAGMTADDKPLYANAVLVNHTPWDFALHFQQVVVPVKVTETRIMARPVAIINMPATLIRGFIEALQSNLERYESEFGKIDIPKKADIPKNEGE